MRYDIIKVILEELDFAIFNIFKPLIVVEDQKNFDSNENYLYFHPLGSIHSVITWIVKYQHTLQSIYCPQNFKDRRKSAFSNTIIDPTPQTDFLNFCDISEYIPIMCYWYVYGSPKKKNNNDINGNGAYYHISNHCTKVWDRVKENPSEMLQRHDDGTFFTHAPRDVWEILHQHINFSFTAKTPLLSSMLIEVICNSLSQHVSTISEYVVSFEISDNLTDHSNDLELLCAIANDNAKHMEEIASVVQLFPIDIRSHVSDLFGTIMSMLVEIGESCLTKLSSIAFDDTKKSLERVFTNQWLSAKDDMNVVIATLDDYLRDYRTFLMPYWSEKMTTTFLDELVLKYTSGILFNGSKISEQLRKIKLNLNLDSTEETGIWSRVKTSLFGNTSNPSEKHTENQLETFDPNISNSLSSLQPNTEIPVINNDKYEKYLKMKSMNLPDGAIRQEMNSDGINIDEIDLFISSPSSQSSSTITSKISSFFSGKPALPSYSKPLPPPPKNSLGM